MRYIFLIAATALLLCLSFLYGVGVGLYRQPILSWFPYQQLQHFKPDSFFAQKQTRNIAKLNKLPTKTFDHKSFLTISPPVQCPEKYIAIVSFGQSNFANRVLRKSKKPELTDAYMYDWVTRQCYLLSEPLVGTDGNVFGNVLYDMAENLLEEELGKPIIMAPLAKGGTSVFSWYNGKESSRLDEFLKSAKISNLELRYWLWMQGEADAVPERYVPEKLSAFGNARGEVDYYYAQALDAIFSKIKSSFPNAKFGVSLTSQCSMLPNLFIRKGQWQVIQQRDDTYLSIDTDALDNTYRRDGCHYNERGAMFLGESYTQFIMGLLP